jgi:hypothetical protein
MDLLLSMICVLSLVHIAVDLGINIIIKVLNSLTDSTEREFQERWQHAEELS